MRAPRAAHVIVEPGLLLEVNTDAFVPLLMLFVGYVSFERGEIAKHDNGPRLFGEHGVLLPIYHDVHEHQGTEPLLRILVAATNPDFFRAASSVGVGVGRHKRHRHLVGAETDSCQPPPIFFAEDLASTQPKTQASKEPPEELDLLFDGNRLLVFLRAVGEVVTLAEQLQPRLASLEGLILAVQSSHRELHSLAKPAAVDGVALCPHLQEFSVDLRLGSRIPSFAGVPNAKKARASSNLDTGLCSGRDGLLDLVVLAIPVANHGPAATLWQVERTGAGTKRRLDLAVGLLFQKPMVLFNDLKLESESAADASMLAFGARTGLAHRLVGRTQASLDNSHRLHG